jgi:hypothetical protein
MLGIHLLFGSFLAGLTIPRNPRLVADLRAKFETATLTLLLPLPLFLPTPVCEPASSCCAAARCGSRAALRSRWR